MRTTRTVKRVCLTVSSALAGVLVLASVAWACGPAPSSTSAFVVVVTEGNKLPNDPTTPVAADRTAAKVRLAVEGYLSGDLVTTQLSSDRNLWLADANSTPGDRVAGVASTCYASDESAEDIGNVVVTQPVPNQRRFEVSGTGEFDPRPPRSPGNHTVCAGPKVEYWKGIVALI